MRSEWTQKKQNFDFGCQNILKIFTPFLSNSTIYASRKVLMVKIITLITFEFESAHCWSKHEKQYLNVFFKVTRYTETSCLNKSLVLKWFYGLEREKNYRAWLLPTSGISGCGISQGKTISVNWILCYRFFNFVVGYPTLEHKTFLFMQHVSVNP